MCPEPCTGPARHVARSVWRLHDAVQARVQLDREVRSCCVRAYRPSPPCDHAASEQTNKRKREHASAGQQEALVHGRSVGRSTPKPSRSGGDVLAFRSDSAGGVLVASLLFYCFALMWLPSNLSMRAYFLFARQLATFAGAARRWCKSTCHRDADNVLHRFGSRRGGCCCHCERGPRRGHAVLR